MMIYELSRDYARAWELIQQGDRLACWVDCGVNRVVANASQALDTTWITDNQRNYLFLSSEQNNQECFLNQCTVLNIEFYLVFADNMLVISEERFTEITSKTIDRNFENLRRHRDTTNHPN